MELSEFDQMDMGLARVAAIQQLGMMISKRTGRLIAEIKIVNGRWRCFVPGRGWLQASDLLFGAKPVECGEQAAGQLPNGGSRDDGGLKHRIMQFIRNHCKLLRPN